MSADAAGSTLLLTGWPGVGKTTAVAATVDLLIGCRLGGFITEELRDGNGKRRGFQMVTFDGEVAVIAHAKRRGAHQVGKYGVDVATIDRVAAKALADDSADAYLVDEIGRMECLSSQFTDRVRGLLRRRRLLVATVAERGEGLIAEVKEGAEMWEVTAGNRDELPDRIAEWVMRRLS